MFNLTCMISIAEFDKWSVYSSKIVKAEDVVKTLNQWKEDMMILGWEHKTFMESIELVTH